jgi:hypothetical protein
MLFPEPIFPQQPPEDEKFTVLCLEHKAVCIHREELRLFDKALKLLGSASIRRPFQFRYFSKKSYWNHVPRPVLWANAVAHVVFGAKSDREFTPGDQLRLAVERASLSDNRGPPLIESLREAPPCETRLSDINARSGLACMVLWPLWKASKLAAYRRSNVTAWELR